MARPIRKLSIDNNGDESRSRDKIMVVNKNEINKFVSIMKKGNIGLLLDKDKCCSYIDNYLLATVFVYFKRADLELSEYTEENFWICLYLAHDQEEDEEELKWELLPWALGEDWNKTVSRFLAAKDQLWGRMGFRSLVSKKQCDQVMTLSRKCGVWTRYRHHSHGGAVRRLGDQYQPRGPAGLTPSFSTLCTRCSDGDDGTCDDSEIEDTFVITDSLDINVEDDINSDDDTDDTLAEVSMESDSYDSGLESSDEFYRNIDIFAKD